MSEIKVKNKGDKFAHASIGSFNTFEGKQFFKESIDSTSCEISFGTLPTGAEVPFYHSHRENEENYIILSGAGRFQVDDEAFDIAEGSVIRVGTNCNRNIKCTSIEPMTYICIQAKEGSLGKHTAEDAEITQCDNKM